MKMVQKNKMLSSNVFKLVSDIKQIIESGKNTAYAAINTVMISIYRHVGKRIVDEEQQGYERAKYGKELIKTLAKELTDEYGNGFSERYLLAFRQSYIVVPNYEIWKSRFPNLTWTHVFSTLRVGD